MGEILLSRKRIRYRKYFVTFVVVNLQKPPSLCLIVWGFFRPLNLSLPSKHSFYIRINILQILVFDFSRYLLVPAEGIQITRMSLRVYLEPHKCPLN